MRKRNSLKEALLERGITNAEADALIFEAKAAFRECIADGQHDVAYDICNELFGLEPDYIFDLM